MRLVGQVLSFWRSFIHAYKVPCEEVPKRPDGVGIHCYSLQIGGSPKEQKEKVCTLKESRKVVGFIIVVPWSSQLSKKFV